MAFTMKWVEHDVVQGRCKRCGLVIGVHWVGVMCMRVNVKTGLSDMTFQGPLTWGEPCTPRTPA
jgi:hypothetical protein